MSETQVSQMNHCEPQSARRRVGRFGLMAAALAMVTSGCFFTAGDPATTSLIANETGTPIEIEAVLDRTQWRFGFEPAEYEVWLSERTDEWIRTELQEYVSLSGGADITELIAVDLDRWAGTYRIAAGASMIIDDSLGDGPNVRFDELSVTTGNGTTVYSGQAQILAAFAEDEERLYILTVGAGD